MNTEVVSIRGFAVDSAVCDVYIGRDYAGWKDVGFGNRASTVAKSGSRAQAIADYKVWFWNEINTNPEFKQSVLKLRGKKLGCWCAPKACHGDVIVAYIEWHEQVYPEYSHNPTQYQGDACSKCDGSGYLPQYAGIFEGKCFRCHGSGKEPAYA